MSTSGLSAMVSGALCEGDTVTLEPVAGGPASARVRHQLGRLYGFEFVDLSAEQTAQIEQNSLKFARTRRHAKSALMSFKVRGEADRRRELNSKNYRPRGQGRSLGKTQSVVVLGDLIPVW